MERLVSSIVQYIQQGPDAIARLIVASVILHLALFLFTFFIAARVGHIENCLRDEWPVKFNRKF